MKRFAFAALLLGVAGCKDKAEPAYKQCVAAEANGDVLTAEVACKNAVHADEKSTSGKAAAAKLTAMRPAIDKANKEKAEAEAAAAKAAEAARLQRLATLKAKVKKKYYDDEPDSECTGKGLPAYRWGYEGGTFAEDQEVAEADRCVKLTYSPELQVYCCPQKPVTGLF
jgi:hypothetical protein